MRLRLISFASAVLTGLLACSAPPPDAQRIENHIREMAQAVEARDRGAFMDAIASDFSGQTGAYDRAEIEGMVRVHLLRNRHINVLLSGLEIDVRGDRATARFTALLTGSEQWFPERGRRYAFETGWRLDDGEWRVVNARWE